MNTVKNIFKWGVIVIIGISVLSFLFGRGNAPDKSVSNPSPSPTSENLEVDRPYQELTIETENEIFYRFMDVQSEVGFDVAPQIGQKNAPTPKRDKAIRMVADEYSLSTKQTREVIATVEKRQPTDEEMRIFTTYDNKLNEAIDLEAAGKAIADEDKIRKEVASSLGITEEKLANIWIRVSAWKGENETTN